MTRTPDPIQELVTAARRKQILDAATQVFAEKGFHRATIKDIARVAGIADGTIYTYFASKTEVLLGILHRLNESTEREQDDAHAIADCAKISSICVGEPSSTICMSLPVLKRFQRNFRSLPDFSTGALAKKIPLIKV